MAAYEINKTNTSQRRIPHKHGILNHNHKKIPQSLGKLGTVNIFFSIMAFFDFLCGDDVIRWGTVAMVTKERLLASKRSIKERRAKG